MTGRLGWLLGFFRRADQLGAPPSGWALALDAAVAMGAAAGAVYEMTRRDLSRVVFQPGTGSVQHFLQLSRQPLAQQGQLVLVGSPHASPWMLAAAALTALPLAWRRLCPIAAWLVIIAAIVALRDSYVPPVALGTAVYAAYSATVHSRYRNLAFAMVTVVTVAAAGWLGDELPRFPGRLTAVFAILPAAALGLGSRELRRRLADSTARLSRAADEAAAATERALAAERARIASELHDVVTHNVSVMVVQAGAARKIMASSPTDAEDALLAVEATGREAMTELRNLLGLLSPAADGTGEPAPPGAHSPGGRFPSAAVPAVLRPQPGLGELDALLGRVRAAGVPVRLTVTGTCRVLSPGADLSAYRVVQEGLTNVLRHAGTASASVAVHWGDQLELTVTDDGHGACPDDARSLGLGRGLLGLRERLALYGGELAAGARPDGGWRVRAVLPLPGPGTAGPAG